jgi:TPR repeat protein
MAIDKGNIDAMYNLGYYYHYKQSKSKQESYIKAIKYYLMAINHGNVKSMYNLGLLYHRYYIDHSNMQQYYLMAIEYGCLKSMNNLGYYYYDIYENYELIKKYFLHIVRKKSTNVNHIYLVPSKKTLGYIKSLYELYEETDYDYL